jgi:hypothetical protein
MCVKIILSLVKTQDIKNMKHEDFLVTSNTFGTIWLMILEIFTTKPAWTRMVTIL